ncbi:cytochrome-c peroxidase [Aliiroseovarius sp. YM-037]|uniref:cytochrome-c peroxidase n=1 Tax=Aliiroseovarius sp. YM-037 TaxID=3341728 RepID=UPI003A7FC335
MWRWLAFCMAATPAFAEPLPKADAVFAPLDMAQVELGQLLFYDPILSGSREVACATCHHPRFGTSDGVSLGLGDGAVGLGPERVVDPENTPEQRVPRNATALWNLGAPEFDVMFHDGRLEADARLPTGIRTPLGEDMAAGFASVLSAQSMFPVLSPDEMAGHYSENDVAQAVRQGFLSSEGGAWDILAARVEAIPAYRQMFDPVIGAGQSIHFTDISDALAAFIAFEWRADDSPFDRFLRDGEDLPEQAAVGLELFYGRAGCSSCHAGQFQTDHQFHAIAMPQIGPGKAARFESHARDQGRMRVTGDPADAYAFRTPSLRNVTETAPYGHSGAYATLEAVVRHHLDPIASLQSYDPAQAILSTLPGAEDWRILDDPTDMEAIAAANTLDSVALTDAEVDALLAFLAALTDEGALQGRLGVPDAVPSGLPVP